MDSRAAQQTRHPGLDSTEDDEFSGPVSAGLRALQAELFRVTEDPSARGRSAAYLAMRDMRMCPSSQLRLMHWLTGEPDLNEETIQQSYWMLDRCSGGSCFDNAESAEAFDKAILQARAVLGQMPAGRQALGNRTKAVLAIAPYVAKGPAIRFPKLAGDRGEFDSAGQALTVGEAAGRVALYVDPVARGLRSEIADATIRILGRTGFDVDVPPGEQDCGWVRDQLGDADEAGRRMASSVERWERTLERAREDDRPRAIEQFLTLGVADAEYVSQIPQRLVSTGPSMSSELRDMLATATDITAWLCGNDIGPPVRWSSLRVGLLGSGDGRRRQLLGGAREDAVANLIRNAGYSVRPLHSQWTASGGSGLMPWLAPDLTDRLRRQHLARVRAGALDVIAVEEAGCASVLAPVAPCPVVHVVELIDWAYGGPVPAGLERLADTSVDIATPDAAASEAGR